MNAPSVRHPLFARLYAHVITRNEPDEVTAHRDELLVGLAGRVLEIGAGAGINFARYPASVTEVVAVEPEPYLRERANAAAAEAPVRVTVVDGLADALPAADGSFDAAVACLMLCSVPDQATALAELHRVVRPGGELRFYEHVRAPSRRTQRVQELVDRTFWPHVFGGCHTARDTVGAIAAAGFAIERHREMQLDSIPSILPVATHALGVARRV
jgi:ubiquinone/menaquinone biosynthesis C-methylase UbiE